MNGASTLECLVAQWAAQRPEGIALRTEEGPVTWAEWHRRIARTEQQLANDMSWKLLEVGVGCFAFSGRAHRETG